MKKLTMMALLAGAFAPQAAWADDVQCRTYEYAELKDMSKQRLTETYCETRKHVQELRSVYYGLVKDASQPLPQPVTREGIAEQRTLLNTAALAERYKKACEAELSKIENRMQAIRAQIPRGCWTPN